MSTFIFLAVFSFFLSNSSKNLFLASLAYFLGILFISPMLDLGWRSFFLSWVYVSGIFALVVYVSAFSSRKKQKSVLGFFFLFCFPWVFFFIPSGNSVYSIYFLNNLYSFQMVLLFLISLLPLISQAFGPTISCRSIK